MADVIRTVRMEEFEDLMRFLERCFAHSWDFFPRAYPHRYLPDEESCSCGYVVESGGRIAAHVGLYPIELTGPGSNLQVGGVGGVATLPEERGKGHMSRLLRHVIGVMRDRGYAASALGGDRQRYGAFGWEEAGVLHNLVFSRRSLERGGVRPVAVQEQAPWTIAAKMQELRAGQVWRPERPRLERQLHKQGARAWVAEDGYLLVTGEGRSRVNIMEGGSGSGSEAALIRGVLEATQAPDACWALSQWDEDRTARLMPCAAGWSAGRDWFYRVISLHGLLESCRPFLEAKAAGGTDFETTLRVREFDGRREEATVIASGGKLEITPRPGARTEVELDSAEAARLLFGGAPTAVRKRVPEGLARLLPVPIHVPWLDHV